MSVNNNIGNSGNRFSKDTGTISMFDGKKCTEGPLYSDLESKKSVEVTSIQGEEQCTHESVVRIEEPNLFEGAKTSYIFCPTCGLILPISQERILQEGSAKRR